MNNGNSKQFSVTNLSVKNHLIVLELSPGPAILFGCALLNYDGGSRWSSRIQMLIAGKHHEQLMEVFRSLDTGVTNEQHRFALEMIKTAYLELSHHQSKTIDISNTDEPKQLLP